jgi:hypothetical protein
MSKHRILDFKPQLRLEWRGQDSQHETQQPDHSAGLGDSIMLSTQTRFSVHTGRDPDASNLLFDGDPLTAFSFAARYESVMNLAFKRRSVLNDCVQLDQSG